MSFLVWRRMLFGAVFVLITYLTLTPNPDEAEKGIAFVRYIAVFLFDDPSVADKIGHFLGYGLLGATAYWAQYLIFDRKRWIPLLLGAYGAVLEGVQGVGGVRSPELADALANAAGALAGFIGAFVLAKMISHVRSA